MTTTWESIISKSKPPPRRSETGAPQSSFLYGVRGMLLTHIARSGRDNGDLWAMENKIYNANQIDDFWSPRAAAILQELRINSLLGQVLDARKVNPDTTKVRGKYSSHMRLWYTNSGSTYKTFSALGLSSSIIDNGVLGSISLRSRRGAYSPDKKYTLRGNDYMVAFRAGLKPDSAEMLRKGIIPEYRDIRSIQSLKLALKFKGLRLRSSRKRGYYGNHPQVHMIYTSNPK